MRWRPSPHTHHTLRCRPLTRATCQGLLHEAFAQLAALSKDQGRYRSLLTDLLVQVRVPAG